MKITSITPLVLGTRWRNLVILKVETDEGLVGLGESRPVNKVEAVIGHIKDVAERFVLGLDPFNIELLVQRLTVEDYGRPGEVAMTGLAMIEMACWDIIGKALNQPVYRLLGGAVRERIKTYANGWYTVERTPEEFAAAARRAVAKGYRALKFDPFGAGYYEMERSEKLKSIALVEAVRDAVGPEVELLIEMHGRFNPVTAVEMARELAPFKPSWYEEPVPPANYPALKKVADAIAPLGVPVATGERIHTLHDYRELLELHAADILQPDIAHFGGILNTKKLAAWADAYYVLMAPHNVGGPIATAAALHLAACTPNFKIQENFNDFDEPYVLASAPGLPAVEDGYFPLPPGPGLGVTLDEAVVAEHPEQRIHFNLFKEGWHKRDARMRAE
ncbi:mandelate racemase/muconate lactonizing enzyme family protein [Caldilinea sp.]|jgi:galactonate dehydratase|uniref:mandelate racemase/muconate lactonizing enzyme family protein n=1 Tax=Caldilinea sp. TaxID=2293560 RepID=UPI0021DD133B|nr:mandelate racemase/muconate lactonizing enzyme family protein [Caldilinea sp.]GIV71089.1 MAG: dehydratase [Caldilinea sp.]